MALLDRLLYGTRLTRFSIVGLILGFLGVAMLIRPTVGERLDLLASLVTVGAALSWALGSLYSRHAAVPKNPNASSGMQMICGGLVLLAISAGRGELTTLDLSRVTAASVLALGYLVLFGSVVAYSAYMWLLSVAKLTTVSTYAYVNPVVAILLGWGLLGEQLSLKTLTAAAVVLLAVAVIVASRAKVSGAPGRLSSDRR
jgi:drug/metabolite transporter (DMT)-like permease